MIDIGNFKNHGLLKIKGLLLTVDLEAVFDSVNHQFLINILKTFWLRLSEMDKDTSKKSGVMHN